MSNDKYKKTIIGNSPIIIGRFTYGFENIKVRQWNEGAALNIGSFCSIAKDVTIFLGGNHRIDWISTFPFGKIFQSELGGEGITGHPSTKGDVIIGSDVWIGSGTTIMSGINIGHGAVIAANSCVVTDVEPYSVFGGNPAKFLKHRFDKQTIDFLLRLKWWDLPVPTIRNISTKLCSKPSPDLLVELSSLIN